MESIAGRPMNSEYVDEHREGDHICYISSLKAIKSHYPGWEISKDLFVPQ